MELINKESLLMAIDLDVQRHISDMNRFIDQGDVEQALESQNIAVGLRSATRMIIFGNHGIGE